MLEVLIKELKHKFFSPVAYILYFLSLAFMGFLTFSSILVYNKVVFTIMANKFYAQQYNVMDFVISPLFNDMGFMLLLIVPFITMTTFSLERRTGTLELLLSYPVSDWAIVIGKFLANLIVVLVVPLLFSLPLFLYAKYQPSADLNAMIASLIGLLLLSALAVALGNFISSLTDSVFISVMLSVIAFLFLWMIGPVANYANFSHASLIEKLSLSSNYSPFTKGIIDLQNVVFFLGFTIVALYLTVLSLEWRYWGE